MKAAFRSSLLKDMIEMLGNDSNGLDAPIPMVNVDAVNLEKVTKHAVVLKLRIETCIKRVCIHLLKLHISPDKVSHHFFNLPKN